MTGKARRQPGTLEAFTGRHVEVRVQGGGLWRGRLVGVTDDLIEVERHGGRSVLVPVGALVALLDEECLALAASRGEATEDGDASD